MKICIKKRSILTFMTYFIILSSALSQSKIIGSIIDGASGDPLIGAVVSSKEFPQSAVISDIDGKYEITVPDGTTALLFDLVGYNQVTQTIDGRSIIDISMEEGTLLKDVVIIGYGTVKREDATGSVQTVSSQNFNKGAITSPQELLAGKVAGVTISTDGNPGGGSVIRVRGESSISASNDPLIVIDGVPIDNSVTGGNRNILNVINPNDIETFTVLKDASAAAIYGNRASGGVIIITTKKGALGKKLSVSYNANVNVGQARNNIDVLAGDEYRELIQKRVSDKKIPESALALLGKENTIWQDQVLQSAIGQDHNLTLSGGLGIVPYRVSLGFTDKNGLLKTDNFNRTTVGINLTPGFLNNTLQVKIQGKAMQSQNHFADGGAIGNSLWIDPTQAPLDPTSVYGGYYTWKIANGNPNSLAPRNPLALLNLRDDDSQVNQIIGNIAIDYRLPFVKDLRANLNLGIDQSKGTGDIIIPKNASFAFDDLLGGGVKNAYENKRSNQLLEFFLNYNKGLGKHNVDIMGGYSWQRFYTFNRDLRNNFDGTDNEDRPDTQKELYLLSLFSRLNYSYNDRFLATFSVRNDHTSRFGPKARSGVFPAAALAYKVFENDKRLMNSLKLRLGYGVTGQERVNPVVDPYYIHLGTYLTSNNSSEYQLGEQYYATLRPEAYNELLKWEENTTYNVAADVSIIKNRLSTTVELYQRYAKDALANVPLPALQNLSNFGDINLGEMQSKGIEISINASPISTKKTQWDIALNGGYNQAEVIDIPNPIYLGGIAGGVGSNIQILSSGFQPYSFFVYKQKYDENGTFLEGQYEDIDGNGVVTSADRYVYQSRAPRFTMGITNNLRINNFDLSFAGRAYLGNYMYNNILTDGGYLERLYHSSGYLSNVPRSAVNLNVEKQSSLTFSDHFVEDASFFRLDHVTLGYNIPKMYKTLSARIYATVQNPLVITNYSGLDPEEFDGIDNNTYPRPRTMVFGFNVNF
jgi:TonB-dependent starch-binding outer membrane protein SusC